MQRRFIILIALSFLWRGIFAQDKKVDSLLKAAKTERSDTSRIKTYLKISSIYLNKGIADSCNAYAHLAYDLSKKNKFLKGLATSSNFMGQVASYTGATDSAIYYFKEAMGYFKTLGDVSREAGMLNNLGVVYKEQGNISKSLDYYFESLKIKELSKDTDGIANVCSNIGHLYSESNDTVNALKYHTLTLELRRKKKDRSGISISLMAIGLLYQNTDKLDKALPYLQEGLKIAEELGEEETIAIGCYNLANVYYKQHRIEECTALYNRSLTLSKKNKNLRGIATCLEILAQISLDKNQTKEAIKMLDEAYVLAETIENKELMESVSRKLSEACESNGDHKKALKYLKLSNTLRDSLFNSENIRKLTSEGLKYEHEKENLIQQAREEKKEALRNAESFRKNLIIGFSVLLLVVISGFSYTLLKKLKENKKQKELIEEQRNEMISSISYARRIQYALLAHHALLNKNLPPHFVLFKPKDIVSGDFYWGTAKDGFFYLAVCDCTGHGVPGAFMSLLNINFLNEAINEKNITAPHEILNYVRERLIEKMDGGRDGMDAILIRIPTQKTNTLRMEYAAANNVPLLVKNNDIVNLPKDKMPVGLGENTASFSTHTIDLQSGDWLYLYTDGFADQFGGPRGKKFMRKKLDYTLLANCNEPVNSQEKILLNLFDKWKGTMEQVDDVCIVGIQIP